MATNIPPHNLGEIIDGLVALLNNPQMTIDELCQYVKGPDFPTGGIIHGYQGIMDAYKTGRGHIQLRARYLLKKRNVRKRNALLSQKFLIRLIKRNSLKKLLSWCVKRKSKGSRIYVMNLIVTEMRIMIELKRNEYAEVILNQLYKHTQMQVTFGAIMLALVDQRPQYLNLKQMMEYFLQHRRTVIIRRTRFLLNKAEARDHIVQGLLIALDNIDAVVSLIRASQTPQIARVGLMENFSLTKCKAQAILDIACSASPDWNAKNWNRNIELLAENQHLNALLAEPALVTALIQEELLAVKTEYGDSRRNEIVADSSDIT